MQQSMRNFFYLPFFAILLFVRCGNDRGDVGNAPIPIISSSKHKEIKKIDYSYYNRIKGSFKVPDVNTIKDGWIAYAYWDKPDNVDLSSFSATWIVPDEPKVKKDQLIFLFTGIQTEKAPLFDGHILKPVLQWGESIAGGGKYWSMACWYAGSGNIFISDLVKVNPGDVITTKITSKLSEGQPYVHDYYCVMETDKGEKTDLGGRLLPELSQFVVSLEGYTLSSCDEYPSTVKTTFSDLNIVGKNIPKTIPWGPVVLYDDCGEKVDVVNPSSNKGTIDIYY